MNLNTPEQLSILELRTPDAQEFYFSAIEKIFWETSAKTDFLSNEEKLLFRKKYLDLYFYQSDMPVFIALKQNQNESLVLGYLIGSKIHLPLHFQLHPYLNEFKPYFESYPADLHINFTSDAQGLGLGSKLLNHYLEHLKMESISVVHLFTGYSSRNRHFYEKNGFHEVSSSPQIHPSIVMLGQTLSS